MKHYLYMKNLDISIYTHACFIITKINKTCIPFSVRHKALYFNELGRMFDGCHQAEKARHYYRKSADVAITQQELENKAQLDLQTQMLMAGINDTG